jgi:hypothetical protein
MFDSSSSGTTADVSYCAAVKGDSQCTDELAVHAAMKAQQVLLRS